ncbi:MAG: hypothetical protein IJO60_12565 [Agathobacter sp.]|nr:hypothetical protein [Agathobacter sp.]
MNFMEKLERKWGRYAVYELHKYLIGAYCIGFVLDYLPFDISLYLAFDMNSILHGQIWRLVTWVFCTQGGGLLTLLFLFCLVPMGRTLEHFLGTFRMNVLLIGGMLFNLVGGILIYAVSSLVLGFGLPVMLTNYYVLLSMFMALAICIPDATVNLYFILPIKMKWMLVVYIGSMLYELYQYYMYGGIVLALMFGAQIIFTLLNLFVFFHLSKIRLSRKQRKRQREFRAQMASEPRAGAGLTRHKCAICGRTEKDDPNLSFRYCSKCTGNKEYCQEHLFTHTHQ